MTFHASVWKRQMLNLNWIHNYLEYWLFAAFFFLRIAKTISEKSKTRHFNALRANSHSTTTVLFFLSSSVNGIIGDHATHSFFLLLTTKNVDKSVSMSSSANGPLGSSIYLVIKCKIKYKHVGKSLTNS